MPENFNFEFNPAAADPKNENPEPKKEIRENAEKVKLFIEKISEELRKEGIPVNSDCRINMNSFRKALGFKERNVQKHKEYVEKREKNFYEEMTEEEKKEMEEEKIMAAGERFERLKTAILYKAFREKFIVVRSSRYDDIHNKVDNVIVEKKTGNVVCAVDEITTNIGKTKNTPDSRFENKKEDVKRKNIEDGGAKLEYGISVEGGKIIKKKFENLPVFYIPMSQETLKKTEKNFISPFNEKGELADEGDKLPDKEYKKSQEEEDFTSSFVSSIEDQIEFLNSRIRLNPTLRKNLLQHKEALEKLENY